MEYEQAAGSARQRPTPASNKEAGIDIEYANMQGRLSQMVLFFFTFFTF